MTNAKSRSVVSLVRNSSYQLDALQYAIERSLELIDLPLSSLIHPGDRVLIKPYLRHGNIRAPETRMVSHPALIEATVRLVRDSGGRPALGDEGSQRVLTLAPSPDEMWLHLLAERSGAELVSFAKAGGRMLPSLIERPRKYLVTRAILDADVVINLANAQLHPRFVWSGAVKNMFNALIGAGNNQLFELLHEREALDAALVDVCRVAHPTVSLSDMTTVCPDSKASLWRMGLIGASTDPLALDSASVQALGWNPATIGTFIQGERIGLGQWARERIELRGLNWEDLPVLREPQYVPWPIHPESTPERLVRIFNKTTLRQRPIINPLQCSRCSDCSTICPIKAISVNDEGLPKIDYDSCADCMVCVAACRDRAISPGLYGWTAVALWPRNVLRNLWRRSKSGHIWRLGSVALRWHLEKTAPVRQPRRGPTPGAIHKEAAMQAPDFKNDGQTAGVALIVGAGPGLGSALAHRFARAGMDIAVVARDGHRLDGLVEELRGQGGVARAYACDVTDDHAVGDMVRSVSCELDVPSLAVYNIEHFGPGHVVDIETAAFLECWRINCLGAFLVGREVARAMLTHGSGTLIFTGATAALRGRDGYANMAVGKWGLRALAQCMARELGPKGIHVAHVVIDGGILRQGASPLQWQHMSGLFPDEIAENYLALHRQHRSTWTQELDLRPWVEKF